MVTLNAQQEQAVHHDSGHLLIIAGPGTGKTQTLTAKIARALEQGVDPGRLVAITFTNKAAEQLQERLKVAYSITAELPFMGTFHSVCLKLLRQQGRFSGRILHGLQQFQLLQNVARQLEFDLGKKHLQEIQRLISLAKNQLIGIEELALGDRLEGVLGTRQLAQLAQGYEQALQQRGALDFDDLIKLMVERLAQPETQAWLKQVQFLFIDEYQDVNEAQYRLVRAMVGSQTTVCAIGDPDQAIYAFRGSNVQHFLRFEQDFPSTTVMSLEQHYRSSQRVLHLAQTLIRHNKERLEKSLVTDNETGEAASLVRFSHPWQEARFVVSEIQKLVGGVDMLQADSFGATDQRTQEWHFSDFAVLYRTKAQGRLLANVFEKAGIPVQLVGGKPWHQQAAVQTILCYLRFLVDVEDDASLATILNIPARGLGKQSLDALVTWADDSTFPLSVALTEHIDAAPSLSSSQKTILSQFMQDLQLLREQLLDATVTHILNATVERFGLEQLFRRGNKMLDRRPPNLLLLLTTAAQFDDQPGLQGVRSLLEYISLLGETDSYDERLQAVSLMTLHAAKGLEFPAVFIVGIEEGLLPYASASSTTLEEERRLFYVGLTRAKQKLMLSHCAERDEQPRCPSSFLLEIDALLSKRDRAAKKVPQVSEQQLALL